MTQKLPYPTPVDKWLTSLDERGKSQHTISAYRRGITHFIDWYTKLYRADFDPALVMPRDVRDWKGYQQTTERAKPATINQRLAAVSSFFQYARAQNLCNENPADAIETVTAPQRQVKSLSEAEVRRLLRAARGNVRDYAMIEVMVGTGLRVGELLALRVGDMVLGERSGKVIVRRGKRDSYREVPLTSDVRKAVTTYLESTAVENGEEDTPLWQGLKGELSNRTSVLRILEKYARIANIHHISPHMLRHTFATRYLAANPDDLRGLARLMGHQSLDTVMIYTEPKMEDLTARMERVEHLQP